MNSSKCLSNNPVFDCCLEAVLNCVCWRAKYGSSHRVPTPHHLNMDSSVVVHVGYKRYKRRRQRGPVQTRKVPNYVVILESGCDIYSYCPKNLAFMRLTTNTFPTAQANFRLFALVQSDEIAAGADLWPSLEGSLRWPCLFNSGAPLKKWNKLITFTAPPLWEAWWMYVFFTALTNTALCFQSKDYTF